MSPLWRSWSVDGDLFELNGKPHGIFSQEGKLFVVFLRSRIPLVVIKPPKGHMADFMRDYRSREKLLVKHHLREESDRVGLVE